MNSAEFSWHFANFLKEIYIKVNDYVFQIIKIMQ